MTGLGQEGYASRGEAVVRWERVVQYVVAVTLIAAAVRIMGGGTREQILFGLWITVCFYHLVGPLVDNDEEV